MTKMKRFYTIYHWLSTREDRDLSEEEDLSNELRQQQKIYAVFLDHHLRQFKVRHRGRLNSEFEKKTGEVLIDINNQGILMGEVSHRAAPPV
jgi:hypothetical protein